MKVDKTLAENLAEQIKNKIADLPEVAVILGSGLAQIADDMTDKIEIPYKTLKGMPLPNVKGHKDQFVVGKIGEKTVIAMQGRFHPYEGWTAKESVLPIYIFKLLGVKNLIVTNSAGAVNKSYDVGDIMLIKDHINLTAMNPLIGGAIVDYGIEFIDLKGAYDKLGKEKVKQIAQKNNIDLKEGVYTQMLGPSYETPAEVKYLRAIGTDAVAMSTVLEVIAGRQCGMSILGFSCISNKAVEDDECAELSHEEVLASAKMASKKLSILIMEYIKQL